MIQRCGGVLTEGGISSSSTVIVSPSKSRWSKLFSKTDSPPEEVEQIAKYFANLQIAMSTNGLGVSSFVAFREVNQSSTDLSQVFLILCYLADALT